MPLRDRSINFACTNNRIDLNRINQVSRLHSGNVYVSNRRGAVGWNNSFSRSDVCASGVVERWCYSSRAPAWPCGCPLSAGTSTVNGKFTPERFSWSQLKPGFGHIARQPQACQYLMLIVMVCLRKRVGDWPSQFTTRCWVIPITGVVQETVISCIHLTCLETYIVCVFWGTDWCRK